MSYRKRNAPSAYEDLAIVHNSSLVSIGYKPAARFVCDQEQVLALIHSYRAGPPHNAVFFNGYSCPMEAR